MSNTEIFKTPFPDLNDLMSGGFRPGSLVVVGGATCMGKTSFLISLLCKWTKEYVDVISLEQGREEFLNLIMSCDTEVSLKKILTKQTTAQEFQRIAEFSQRMDNSVIGIDDERENLWAIIEEAVDQGCKILMIDSLQRIISKMDIYQEMSLVVNKLREISIKNNVCIIVTSNLNRKIHERQGHRPFLTDLRDSGYIEECADQVILLHRRDYYDPHDKPGQAELILAKNRYGNIGSVILAFRKEIGQFINLEPFIPKPMIEPTKE